jgi:hypothetical protein
MWRFQNQPKVLLIEGRLRARGWRMEQLEIEDFDTAKAIFRKA